MHYFEIDFYTTSPNSLPIVSLPYFERIRPDMGGLCPWGICDSSCLNVCNFSLINLVGSIHTKTQVVIFQARNSCFFLIFSLRAKLSQPAAACNFIFPIPTWECYIHISQNVLPKAGYSMNTETATGRHVQVRLKLKQESV